jgi:superfamily II DNA/RNA helicase
MQQLSPPASAIDAAVDVDFLELEPEPSEMDVAEPIPAEVVSSVMRDLAEIFKPMEESNPSSTRYSHKVRILFRILSECKAMNDKVLVFSQSIPTLDFLESILKSKYKCMRLDGKTKVSDRQNMMKRFNDSETRYDVFLISTKAGGLGFNLPSANRVIIFDFSFNPTHEEQAIGRAYRLGQKKPVFVYRFIIGGTFEDEQLNLSVFKTQLAFTVVEKKNVKSRADRNANWLSLPKTVVQEDLEEHRGKDLVLDRLLTKNNQHILHIRTTETLQEESNETFTAEEEVEIQKEIAREKLRKENPAAYREEQMRLFDGSAYNLLSRQANSGTTKSPKPTGHDDGFFMTGSGVVHGLPHPANRYSSSIQPPARAGFISHSNLRSPATASTMATDMSLSTLSQRMSTVFDSGRALDLNQPLSTTVRTSSA